jgi:hypothetical protein
VGNWNQTNAGASRVAQRRCGILIALLLASCAAPPEGPLSEVSGLSMTCSRPYPLEQDCSIWSRAKREVEIGDVTVRVAASRDGQIVLVMPSNSLKHSFEGDITHASTRGTLAVRAMLEAQRVRVDRQIPVVTAGQTMGHVLELDRDGYALLLESRAE